MKSAKSKWLIGSDQPLTEAVHRLARLLSACGAGAAILLIIYLVLHTCLEIILRGLFSSSTYTLEEYASYAMGGIVFLPLGYAMQSGAMIRMTMTTSRMSVTVRRWAEVVSTVLAIGFAGAAVYYYWLSLARNWLRNATSETAAAVPLWILDAIPFVGLLILCLQLTSYALRVARGGAIVEGEEVPE